MDIVLSFVLLALALAALVGGLRERRSLRSLGLIVIGIILLGFWLLYIPDRVVRILELFAR